MTTSDHPLCGAKVLNSSEDAHMQVVMPRPSRLASCCSSVGKLGTQSLLASQARTRLGLSNKVG